MRNPYESVAWHEAGHAVVANLSPKVSAIIQVRIVGLPSGQAGSVEHSLEWPPAVGLREKRRQVYEWQRMLWAGPLAQAIASVDSQGPERAGPENDFAKINRLILTDALLDLEAVNGRASKASAARAIEAAIGRQRGAAAAAEFLLRTHWGAVEKIAELLVQCGAMNGEQLRFFIDRAPKTGKLCERDEFLSLASRATEFDPELRASIDATLGEMAQRESVRAPVASGGAGGAIAPRPTSRPAPKSGCAASMRPRFNARTVDGRDVVAALAGKLVRAAARLS